MQPDAQIFGMVQKAYGKDMGEWQVECYFGRHRNEIDLVFFTKHDPHWLLKY